MQLNLILLLKWKKLKDKKTNNDYWLFCVCFAVPLFCLNFFVWFALYFCFQIVIKLISFYIHIFMVCNDQNICLVKGFLINKWSTNYIFVFYSVPNSFVYMLTLNKKTKTNLIDYGCIMVDIYMIIWIDILWLNLWKRK